MLRTFVEGALRIVPGAEEGSVSVVVGRRRVQATAFDDASEHVGLLLASHAAVAYAAAQRQSALLRAIESRQLVGQAEGILMERHRLTAEQAFAALVRSSQDRNVKLHEIARRLVETGVLPAAG